MSRSPTLIAVGDNCLDVYLSKDRMAVGAMPSTWRCNGCARA